MTTTASVQVDKAGAVSLRAVNSLIYTSGYNKPVSKDSRWTCLLADFAELPLGQIAVHALELRKTLNWKNHDYYFICASTHSSN